MFNYDTIPAAEVVADGTNSFGVYSDLGKIYPVCIDCCLPYVEFGLDTTFPDEQWLLIHPEGLHGLLCANCIARRAEKLDGSIAIRATIEGMSGD